MFGHQATASANSRVVDVLNFNQLVCSPTEDLPYVDKKPGGTDVGHVTLIGKERYIIKTGITLSLLGQALSKPQKERMYLGFIVGNFTRITSDKLENHSILSKLLLGRHPNLPERKLAEVLTDELCATFESFKKTAAGIAMLDKTKSEPLCADDVYAIYHYLALNNEVLRDVVGVSAFADVVYGAMGQYFSNTFLQYSGIPNHLLDNHQLLIARNDEKTLFMASRLISESVSFNTLLLKSFTDNQLQDFSSKDEWIDKCQADLSASLTNLRGLGAAIMIRHIMGESADLGPDNMLMVVHEGQQHIINIDVTGFRYPRRTAFIDPRSKETRLGWEEILKTDDNEILVEFLLDKSVFSKRFLTDAGTIPPENHAVVLKVIIDVLKVKLMQHASQEIEMVRDWLNIQNSELSVASLKRCAYQVFAALNPSIKPRSNYLDNITDHASTFITESIDVANLIRIARKDQARIK
jgi:hypothetical protein